MSKLYEGPWKKPFDPYANIEPTDPHAPSELLHIGLMEFTRLLYFAISGVNTIHLGPIPSSG